MELKDLLPRDHVLLHLCADGRRELFCALARPLAATGIIADLDTFVDDLERREQQITTQVESSIALPHSRSRVVRRLGLTVGLADAPGLIYSESSDEPVRLIFLIAVPSFAPTAHLPLLQRLANFAHDRQRVDKLLICTSEAQVVGALARYKG